MTNDACQVEGKNGAALFTLKAHRGDGMCLLGMNGKQGRPPDDFVGFAIEYMEPGGDRFYPLKNRLAFPGKDGAVDSAKLSTKLSPIQKFRWVHFPRNAELDGLFTSRVSPVFMNAKNELSYGEAQTADIALRSETYPGLLNIAYTRGFVASQAFVDKYGGAKEVKSLLPPKADKVCTFKPTHLKADEALAWMGFEARSAIYEVLDQAIQDNKAQVRVACYDLNEPGIISRLQALGGRLRIIIDDSKEHGAATSAETQAAALLEAAAGHAKVLRQHMGPLQPNKMIAVKSPTQRVALFGSANHSWRGVYVQNNNAVVVKTKEAADGAFQAFEGYWNADPDKPVQSFGSTSSAAWIDLGVTDVDAKVSFSPRPAANLVLDDIAADILTAQDSLLFSLAFLYQTKGAMQNAFTKIKKENKVFAYGISDHPVAGLDVLKSNGSLGVVSAASLEKNVPQPFKAEPTGGGGTRMHHKFVVIDFNSDDSRVYTGSYNFSKAADGSNGENLLLIRDRRIAVSYAVEALRIFDHYEFRIAQQDAKKAKKKLQLKRPPRKAGEEPWWLEDCEDPRKVRDREIFA